MLISQRADEDTLHHEIGKYFEMKEESIGPPNIYLGGQMRQVELENGVTARAFGSTQYIKAAVSNVKDYLAKRGKALPTRAKTPLLNGYRPEIDVTDELRPEEASYYQSLIGILRWIVELGQVDICCEVFMMSSHLALPRVDHLEQLFHLFGYLDKHHNSEMVFDPTEHSIDEDQFERNRTGRVVCMVMSGRNCPLTCLQHLDVILSPTILSVRDVPGKNGELPTSTPMTILLIC